MLDIGQFEKFKQELTEDVEKIPEEMSQNTVLPKDVSKEIINYLKGGKKRGIKTRKMRK